jgi:23S rRNA (cytidine1920-2'-O)/16S rRNA (cytidine1409-2'-O)-methyltransferase
MSAENKSGSPSLHLESRGYHKLNDIINYLHYDCRGKIVLDIGSSTGGFTACVLNHGAKQVVAVEKGTNQMAKPLRFDPRIDLREKTDIFDVDRETISKIDLIVADVSFISLRPILAHAKKYLATKETDFLVMLKPQFEAQPKDLVRGVVKNEKVRRAILKDFENWLKNNGFFIKNKRDNLLSGKTGNLERFYYLTIAKNDPTK